MTAALILHAAGPSSTLQDMGRTGWLRFGVSPAGAADPIRLAAANALVGNGPDEAAVEFALAGDTYRVEADRCVVAVAADAPVAVDGEAAAAWSALALRRGQTLSVGRMRSGVRGYVAVAGGFDIPPVLGSRSVHLRSGLGGGRLEAGATLPLRVERSDAPAGRGLDPGALPYVAGPVNVVLGPQQDRFTPEGIGTFLSAAYRVTPEADRMGIRFEGPPIAHADGFNTISDGLAPGSIQVPGTGMPIVVLADRQSTGGYPKIATVASACLPGLGQLRPGDEVRFQAIGMDEAVALRRRQAAALAELPKRLRPLVRDAASVPAEELLGLNLVGGVVDART